GGPCGLWRIPGRILVLHSLRYLDVAVSEPSLGVPQFMEVGFVDGVRFVRYDSEWGRLEPLTQWVKEAADPEYWDRETQINERNQQVNARNLEILRERYNQSRGLHTRQRVYGCDLLSDGSVDGSIRYGYDGRDFISFDLGSGRFVAADSAAEITRRRWEEDGTVAEGFTNYLGHECPDRLRKYVGYGQKELERKEPPAVHVSGKEEHGTLILSCHAYGFYPQTIAVNWMKGDEIWDQETEWGGVVPNSDGTFHTWARIEALPEEREQYRCRVEHPGMPEPGIFAWGEAGKVGMMDGVGSGRDSGSEQGSRAGSDGIEERDQDSSQESCGMEWSGSGAGGMGRDQVGLWIKAGFQCGISWDGWSRIGAGLGRDPVGWMEQDWGGIGAG
uniref:Ig-like domain-containing protein n=1 Tax=Cyanoderma ruficeps TaxID=181631 RepID=A0A8C3QPE2_9PASS